MVHKRLPLIPVTPFSVKRLNEKNGYRGLWIEDAEGHSVCNLSARLDDREVEMAGLICGSVNKAFPPMTPPMQEIVKALRAIVHAQKVFENTDSWLTTAKVIGDANDLARSVLTALGMESVIREAFYETWEEIPPVDEPRNVAEIEEDEDEAAI